MKRREFIAGLGSAAAWPVVARAQQRDRVPLIGVLMTYDENDLEEKRRYSAFPQALADLGWTEGRVRIVLRWGRGDSVRIRALAQELVGLQPDMIFTSGTLPTLALQQETQTIPIVFGNAAEPVASGIVPRLNQPGGNITGFGAMYEAPLGGKWLELLLEIVPGLKRVAIMFNPDAAPVSFLTRSIETAARSLKVEPIIAPVHNDVEIEAAIRDLGREPRGGFVEMPDGFMFGHRALIISAAARNRVPAVYEQSVYPREGGLLSYGLDTPDMFRRAATYVDRILRGAKPGDLPVQFPTKLEMVVNVKTARTLGLTVPQSILLRADEVIE